MLRRVDELGFSNLKLSNFGGTTTTSVNLLKVVKFFFGSMPFLHNRIATYVSVAHYICQNLT